MRLISTCNSVCDIEAEARRAFTIHSHIAEFTPAKFIR